MESADVKQYPVRNQISVMTTPLEAIYPALITPGRSLVVDITWAESSTSLKKMHLSFSHFRTGLTVQVFSLKMIRGQFEHISGC